MFHKWQSYDVWFLRYWVRQAKFFAILDHFLLFYPPKNPKIKILKKMENSPGDIIISHKCNINDNHMMYGSWDIKCDRPNVLLFWKIFAPLWTQKIKIFKRIEKNPWKYYHFTNINDSHMMYGSSDMECSGHNFLSFWTIFCPFTALTIQKIKIWKNEKNT